MFKIINYTQVETKFNIGDVVNTLRYVYGDYFDESGYRIGKDKIIAIKIVIKEDVDNPDVVYLVEGGEYDTYGDDASEWLWYLDGSDNTHLEGIYDSREAAIKAAEDAEVKILK